jgi:hypothetical protein
MAAQVDSSADDYFETMCLLFEAVTPMSPIGYVLIVRVLVADVITAIGQKL